MPRKKKPTPRKGGPRARVRTEDENEFLRMVGAKIKAARIEAGMTGEELAKALGIAAKNQFYREAGKQSGRWEDLYRYAVALGCSVKDLLP